MAYRLLPQSGDCVQVPLLVLHNLKNGREDYFRVVLYLLGGGEPEPASIAAALGLKSESVAARALAFWQGAGLLEEIPDPEAAAPEIKKSHPRLTTREVLLHSGQNPEIAQLMQTAQLIFGEVISESGCSILATMYVNDGMSLEYLSLGLAHFKQQGLGARRLASIQRRMQAWQEQGVTTAEQLEAYLTLLETRRARYGEVAELMQRPEDTFTAAERSRIDGWYEKYHYTQPMIALALGMVGESEKKTVAYLNGILKKWYGSGYRQPRDVLAATQGTNAMPGGRSTGQDILQTKRGFVPKFRLEDD